MSDPMMEAERENAIREGLHDPPDPLPPAKQQIAAGADERPSLPESWPEYVQRMRAWAEALAPTLRRPPGPPYDWHAEGDYL